MQLVKQYLIQALTKAADTLEIPVEQIRVSPPKKSEHGDLSTNLALILAKQTGENPMEVANRIREQLTLDPEMIFQITVARPGFINFHIAEAVIYSHLDTVLAEGDTYGRGALGTGLSANVEFVSANPTGPLTVGHGRQAVLGDTIANILEWHGYSVTREYYYNDAGRQMRLLGQSVEARYFQELGQDRPLPEDGYQGQYILEIARDLLKQYGDSLKPGDPRFRSSAEETIFNDIKQSLDRLGIVHDRFTNEQYFYETGAIDTLVDELREKGLVYDKEGAVWFKTSALGKSQDRVLIKSSGEPTYRLPDMAYHRSKLEREDALIIDIFGSDHVDTYPDVLAAMETLGYDTSSIRVLVHQFVTLVRGGKRVKMSTRKADFVTLGELVKEVGSDVVRYFFLMRGINSHLNFDLDLAADQSEKNPVFYLQYAHARICNILKYGQDTDMGFTGDYNPSLLAHETELHLIKQLVWFPEMMETVLESLEPQVIANYLQELATDFHKFYGECRVISDDEDLSCARLALVTATRTVLASGLNILGIQSPERL